MNVFILTFFCILLSFNVRADKNDFQLKLISASHDTVRIELLNQKAYSLRINHPSQSLFYAKLAEDISVRNNYVKGLINSFKVQSMVSMHQGDHEESMKLVLKALQLADNINDSYQISNCYNIIGSIYQAKYNFEMAIHYFQKSFEIEMKSGNIEQASIRLYNIGTVYELSNQLDKAMSLYQQSLALEEKLGNIEGIIYALYGIGGIHIKNQSLQKAEVVLQRALKLAKEINDLSAISYCTSELGHLYLKMENYYLSEIYFNQSLSIADTINEAKQLINILSGLVKIHARKNDFQKAFFYQSSYINLYEKIHSTESKDIIAELNRKYEMEKRNRELELLQKDNYIKRLELKQVKNLANFIIFMSLIVLILLILNLYSKKTIVPKFNDANWFKGIRIEDINLLFYSKKFWFIALNTYFVLFLMIFEPFGIYYLAGVDKVFSLLICLSIFTVLYIVSMRIVAVLKISHPEIDITKKYIVTAFFSVLMTILIFWIYFGIIVYDKITFAFLIDVARSVIIISIFPSIIAAILSERIIYARYLEKFQNSSNIVSSFNSVLSTEGKQDALLQIKTDNLSELIELNKSELICVEANDNYSAIYYLRNNKMYKDLYRISLKKIENHLSFHDEFVRFHKSYIVNIHFLKRILGNSQKYRLMLEYLDIEIPVSRNFPSQIIQSLRKQISAEQEES